VRRQFVSGTFVISEFGLTNLISLKFSMHIMTPQLFSLLQSVIKVRQMHEFKR
jgi:hypothetical protein